MTSYLDSFHIVCIWGNARPSSDSVNTLGIMLTFAFCLAPGSYLEILLRIKARFSQQQQQKSGVEFFAHYSTFVLRLLSLVRNVNSDKHQGKENINKILKNNLM